MDPPNWSNIMNNQDMNNEYRNNQDRILMDEEEVEWFTAIDNGNIEIIQRLIQSGFNVNTPDRWSGNSDKPTALLYTAGLGNIELATILLQNNADATYVDESGNTAIHHSVIGFSKNSNEYDDNTRFTNYETLINLFLDNGIDINAQNRNHESSLDILTLETFKYSLKEVKLDFELFLLERGADPNIMQYESINFFFDEYDGAERREIRFYHEYFANLVEHGLDINFVDNYGETLLIVHSNSGNLGIVSLLLNNGADPNIPDNEGKTPLYYAAIHNNVQLAELLLQNEAEITELIRQDYLRGVFSEDIRQLFQPFIMNQVNETIVERNIRNNVNVGTCYDLIEIEDINAKNFLKQDKNNIILVEYNQAYCQNRRALPTQLVYECKEANGHTNPINVIREKKYIKIGAHNNFITEEDYRKFFDTQYDIYVLRKIEPEHALVAVVSSDIMDRRGSWVSGDHCQAGSGGKLYALDAYSLQEGIQHLPKTGGKKRGKKWHTRRQKKRSSTRSKLHFKKRTNTKKGGKRSKKHTKRNKHKRN